jgi:CheY-like chemotaxis protein
MSVSVLYADHNRDDREMMDSFFSQYPHIDFVRFPNGQLLLDYIRAVEEDCFCYILLDIDLPEFSGIDTLRELRLLPKTSESKAILFTHHVTDVEKEAAKNLRAELFLKPLTIPAVNQVGTHIVEHCYKYLTD